MTPESVICTVAANFRANTCLGDSGGPTYTDDGKKQTLLGLMSFGKGCTVKDETGDGKLGVPGVRTRLFYHRYFIVSTIEKFLAPKES